jgi:small GTP-binding protein
MIEKLKICMVGATGVGKTSLVGRFVSSIFHEQYKTTIGVNIQTRTVSRGDRELKLVLWDLSGEDEFQSVQPEYVRGAAGYFIVIDGTRPETLDTGISLQERIRASLGDVPFVVVLNKIDLVASWELDARWLQALAQRGWQIARTSAKTGEGVEDAFNLLADRILERWAKPWS